MCFRRVPQCCGSTSIAGALKSSSHRSFNILRHLRVDTQELSYFIPFEIFPVLGMMSDFQPKPGRSHITREIPGLIQTFCFRWRRPPRLWPGERGCLLTAGGGGGGRSPGSLLSLHGHPRRGAPHPAWVGVALGLPRRPPPRPPWPGEMECSITSPHSELQGHGRVTLFQLGLGQGPHSTRPARKDPCRGRRDTLGQASWDRSLGFPQGSADPGEGPRARLCTQPSPTAARYGRWVPHHSLARARTGRPPFCMC